MNSFPGSVSPLSTRVCRPKITFPDLYKPLCGLGNQIGRVLITCVEPWHEISNNLTDSDEPLQLNGVQSVA